MNFVLRRLYRQLEDHHGKPQPTIIGCLANLYGSVVDMGIDNFSTEVCKEMLLRPRSVNEDRFRRVKVNLHGDATRYFMCPMFDDKSSCSKWYSNYSTSRCSCGKLMDVEIGLLEDDKVTDLVGDGGVFVSGQTGFIITDCLNVHLNSVGLVLSTLKGLGYADLSELGTLVIDVGFKEVMTLLGCLFTSDSTLTDVFLRKQSLYRVPRMNAAAYRLGQGCGNKISGEVIALTVFVKKQDRKILCFECGEDFIDLLFTFLAVPLDYACQICCFNLGNVDPLWRSFDYLCCNKGREKSTLKCMLPWYYRCQNELLYVAYQQAPIYYRCISYTSGKFTRYSLTSDINKPLVYGWDKLVPMISVDPRLKNSSESMAASSGFVKRNGRFMVSDDLTVTPLNSSSTTFLLKKLQVHLDDFEEQAISIGKNEAATLFRASFLTSSALTTAFRSLLAKNPKQNRRV
ncbi:PREDICTED: uncharacterized protein LOC104823279 isoform X2 [Tarenaya hassleriana]|uniref:uncharacterized protein LOC104823279 isoform X2 n=1 Tax=Tarenaya hassleriana TaxID=28532 RepID=UPI00053C4097|nr:PREDICTED: uncharacterized protein LOC104823279 isoform X2 [Tarenaya hassleriana]XP_010553074.1 PREDICTED: uncharacterized protein LOC104823279 isoform X2 [Tarenaya hassleriana]XP_010553075.1 PREDICTED: uncharacterized protein LOC104823279 isoform X2 [Tarenaya hassleriana]